MSERPKRVQSEWAAQNTDAAAAVGLVGHAMREEKSMPHIGKIVHSIKAKTKIVDNVPIVISAEGGFSHGDEAVIDLPGDEHHGKIAKVRPASERTCFLTVDGRELHYCVAALRHVKAK